MFINKTKASLQLLARLVCSSEYEAARGELAQDLKSAADRVWKVLMVELATKWVSFHELAQFAGLVLPAGVVRPVSGWVIVLTVVVGLVLRLGSFFLNRKSMQGDQR